MSIKIFELVALIASYSGYHRVETAKTTMSCSVGSDRLYNLHHLCIYIPVIQYLIIDVNTKYKDLLFGV